MNQIIAVLLVLASSIIAGARAEELKIPFQGLTLVGNLEMAEGKSRQQPSVDVVVVGASSQEEQLIRDAAKSAVALFNQCDLEAPPSIQIEVIEAPLDVNGVKAFGDTDSRSIRFVNAETSAKLAATNTTYASLPSREFYKSLAVHEISHLTFRYHLKGRKVSLATHEYVAYALQIASMTDVMRHQFLHGIPREPTSDWNVYNELLLFMSPWTFGALAYDHYSASGNGCRVINALIEGKIEFPSVDEFE